MKTARNAIKLLRQFSREDPELGVSELARRLDMDRAGVHRLLRALVEERFIEQNPETRRYRLGFGILDVAAVRMGQTELLDVAPQRMQELRDAVGETVALLVADGREAVCLAVVESRHTVRVGYDIGERVPLHASAGGLVLLAYLPKSERQAIYAAGLRRYTPNTLTDGDALEARLQQIRAARAGWSADSYHEGIVSAAAPIMSPKQNVAGVVTLAGPMQRRGVDDLPRLSEAARRTADAIAADWSAFSVKGRRLAVGSPGRNDQANDPAGAAAPDGGRCQTPERSSVGIKRS